MKDREAVVTAQRKKEEEKRVLEATITAQKKAEGLGQTESEFGSAVNVSRQWYTAGGDTSGYCRRPVVRRRYAPTFPMVKKPEQVTRDSKRDDGGTGEE